LLDGPGVHRVSFAQDCLIKVTNAPAATPSILTSVLSIEMERARAGRRPRFALPGRKPSMTTVHPRAQEMVGGHLRFAVLPVAG
jgi:hypothetical protein